MRSIQRVGGWALTCLWAAACTPSAAPTSTHTPEPPPPEQSVAQQTPSRLSEVLSWQSDATKARYAARHPKETLEFFGVEPGMTVVDTLPGQVWYVGLLLDYLGPEGTVIPADYAPELWAEFGDQAPDPESRDNWPAKTVRAIRGIRKPHQAQVEAFQYGNVPSELTGTADVVLVVRALHHFMRLEAHGGYLTQALSDMHQVLKPGGVVGVVQHRAPSGNSDEWANGEAGYVKQAAVVKAFENAGFEFVAASEINANPADTPSEADVVWRLPPELTGLAQDESLQQKMREIGESDRMTLKFRKVP